jgi:hypothetical protein
LAVKNGTVFYFQHLIFHAKKRAREFAKMVAAKRKKVAAKEQKEHLQR